MKTVKVISKEGNLKAADRHSKHAWLCRLIFAGKINIQTLEA